MVLTIGRGRSCAGTRRPDGGCGGCAGCHARPRNDVIEGVAGQVGQLHLFEAGPQRLKRVQLGGVGGQWLHHQPRPLPPKPGAHHLAAVGGQPVPHKRRLLATEEAAQPFQRADQGVGVIGADLVVEGQLGAAATGAVAQPGRHRGSLPLEAVADHRGVPLGAQVRLVTGNRDAPDSPQNTKTARRRRALRRILGPVLGHPAGNRPLVTLHGAASGTQQPVVQAVAQQLPHVPAVVSDPGHPFDHGGEAVKGPVVVVEAVCAGALA
jgi:hypothetical protein